MGTHLETLSKGELGNRIWGTRWWSTPKGETTAFIDQIAARLAALIPPLQNRRQQVVCLFPRLKSLSAGGRPDASLQGAYEFIFHKHEQAYVRRLGSSMQWRTAAFHTDSGPVMLG